MAIIRALEVGFGTTSLTTGTDDRNRPKILTFPSFVAQVDPTKAGLNAGLNTRNTVTVSINDNKYEVGPDAHLAADKTSNRVLNSTYISSVQYQALLFGSFVYMDTPKIDLLVLALPVENWSRRDELTKLVLGDHEINGQKYSVKNVWVITQPMGGLLAYANQIGQAGFNEIRDMNILSVDPGYGTFDFITSTGLKVNDARSGGEELGMSAVLDSVGKILRTCFPNLNDFPIEKIDEAFWKNNGFIRISGKKYPFPVCSGKTSDGKPTDIKFDITGAVNQVTNAAVTKLKNKVGSGGDLDLIILMGGPHKVYLPALQKAYPDHEIVIVKNPLSSICEGMHYGGAQYYNSLQKSKRSR